MIGIEKFLQQELVIYVKKGSEHSIGNTGNEDLVMITVVVER